MNSTGNTHRLHACVWAFAFVLLAAGCGGSASVSKTGDEQFGHRYDGPAPDGRETFVITPPDTGVSYTFSSASYDSVYVRPSRPKRSSPSEVELLIKGSFPDSCTELHAVSQTRNDDVVTVDLEVRRPRGRVCASVMRPYRFYVMLDGAYAPGRYTLDLNDETHAFVVGKQRGS